MQRLPLHAPPPHPPPGAPSHTGPWWPGPLVFPEPCPTSSLQAARVLGMEPRLAGQQGPEESGAPTTEHRVAIFRRGDSPSLSSPGTQLASKPRVRHGQLHWGLHESPRPGGSGSGVQREETGLR